MICNNCGGKISESSRFCPKCGARVVFPTHAKIRSNTNRDNDKFNSSYSSEKDNSDLIIAIILTPVFIFLTIFCVVGLFAILNEGDYYYNEFPQGFWLISLFIAILIIALSSIWSLVTKAKAIIPIGFTVYFFIESVVFMSQVILYEEDGYMLYGGIISLILFIVCTVICIISLRKPEINKNQPKEKKTADRKNTKKHPIIAVLAIIIVVISTAYIAFDELTESKGANTNNNTQNETINSNKSTEGNSAYDPIIILNPDSYGGAQFNITIDEFVDNYNELELQECKEEYEAKLGTEYAESLASLSQIKREDVIDEGQNTDGLECYEYDYPSYNSGSSQTVAIVIYVNPENNKIESLSYVFSYGIIDGEQAFINNVLYGRFEKVFTALGINNPSVNYRDKAMETSNKVYYNKGIVFYYQEKTGSDGKLYIFFNAEASTYENYLSVLNGANT